MNKEPKYSINAIVHIHGTPGTGKIFMIEYTGNKFVYHVEYVDANNIRKVKSAPEHDLILIDHRQIH